MKRTVAGFIVFNAFNGPLGLGEGNVLWCDVRVTLFGSRYTAQKAVHRTLQYALDNGYAREDAWKGHFIKPVVCEEV